LNSQINENVNRYNVEIKKLIDDNQKLNEDISHYNFQSENHSRLTDKDSFISVLENNNEELKQKVFDLNE
jgi:hypothetical protein